MKTTLTPQMNNVGELPHQAAQALQANPKAAGPAGAEWMKEENLMKRIITGLLAKIDPDDLESFFKGLAWGNGRGIR